jgi:hypothetical protein
MKEASEKFQEKPLTAVEEGKLWVERVLENKNSSHIRLSLSMSLAKLHNFDVYLIIVTIMLLLLAYPICCVKKLLFFCHNRIVGRSKSKTN